MCVPPPQPTRQDERAVFARLKIALDGLNADGLKLDTLSMGMSGDFESAIAEGATLVRIGTALFGAR
jgi:PLP dependent protein